jgi:hypothetical protein
MKTHNKEAHYLNQQWFYFKQHFAAFIVLLQQGSCYLIEARHRPHLPAQVQQYCVQKRQTLANSSYARLEIPLHYLSLSIKLLQQKKCAYMLITEQGGKHKRLKQRKCCRVYSPTFAL